MKKLPQFFIFINNRSLKNNSLYIHVSLKDEEGETIRKIEENALISDKNFRDLSGLFIGLKEALTLKAGEIFIISDNDILRTLITNEIREDYIDPYGFYPDIKKLINKFEEVKIFEEIKIKVAA